MAVARWGASTTSTSTVPRMSRATIASRSRPFPIPTPPVASVSIVGGRMRHEAARGPGDCGRHRGPVRRDGDGVQLRRSHVRRVVAIRGRHNVAFPAGDGSRTLWVKVRNGVGLESSPVTDAITIDTVSPSVIAIEPPPGSSVSGLRPSIKVTFNEPINAATWTDLGLIVQSAAGSLVAGAYSYDAQRRQGTFVPLEVLQPGAVYAVNVGLVRDTAGNIVAPLTSWAITPLTPTSLLATASHRVVPVGGSSRINVAFSGPQQATSVEMLSSSGTGPFEPSRRSNSWMEGCPCSWHRFRTRSTGSDTAARSGLLPARSMCASSCAGRSSS